ncbi:MAG TPA: hypothetical protein VI358_14025 [Pseudolabrys sp.]
MINDAGKHQVNGTSGPVSLRAGLLRLLDGWIKSTFRINGGFEMKALAEQIADIDGVEIYGRAAG